MIGYNTPITFGQNGSIKQLDPVGFDLSEAKPQSWTNSQSCEFDVLLPAPRQDVKMVMTAAPFRSAPVLTSQQLYVFVNGLFHGFHLFQEYDVVEFKILRHVISSRPTKIQFVIPTAVSPKSLDISSDGRLLGLSFTDLVFLNP